MKLTTLLSALFFVLGLALSAVIEDPAHGDLANTVNAAPKLALRQAVPPPPGTSCNPNCRCPHGHKNPSEGTQYCGYCGEAESTNGAPIANEDVVVCKNDGCCNYGVFDHRCEIENKKAFCAHNKV